MQFDHAIKVSRAQMGFSAVLTGWLPCVGEVGSPRQHLGASGSDPEHNVPHPQWAAVQDMIWKKPLLGPSKEAFLASLPLKKAWSGIGADQIVVQAWRDLPHSYHSRPTHCCVTSPLLTYHPPPLTCHAPPPCGKSLGFIDSTASRNKDANALRNARILRCPVRIPVGVKSVKSVCSDFVGAVSGVVTGSSHDASQTSCDVQRHRWRDVTACYEGGLAARRREKKKTWSRTWSKCKSASVIGWWPWKARTSLRFLLHVHVKLKLPAHPAVQVQITLLQVHGFLFHFQAQHSWYSFHHVNKYRSMVTICTCQH